MNKEYRKRNKYSSLEALSEKYSNAQMFESKISLISIIDEDINKENFWSFTVTSILSATVCLVGIFLIETINLSFVGNTDESEINLTAVGMGNIILNFSSLFFVFGSLGALDTVGSFIYGQKDFVLLNLYTIRMRVFIYTCFIFLTLPFCIYSDKILSLIGISSLIAERTNIYTLYMIPTIFMTFNLHVNVKYLQVMQNYNIVSAITILSTILHYAMNYVMFHYFYSDFYVITYISLITVSLAFIASTVYIHLLLPEDRRMIYILPDVFNKDMTFFYKLALYSATQHYGDYIGYEIIGFIGCFIPPEQSSAASLIVLNYSTIVSYLYSGSSFVLSQIVGYCLGKEDKALYFYVVRQFLKVNFVVAGSLCLFTFYGKFYILSLYTNNNVVIDYAYPILTCYAFFIIVDTYNVMFQGILRGSGNQHIPSLWNILMTLIITIPIGYVFAFVLGFKVIGLWIGIFTFMFSMLVISFFYSYRLDFSSESLKLKSELTNVNNEEEGSQLLLS